MNMRMKIAFDTVTLLDAVQATAWNSKMSFSLSIDARSRWANGGIIRDLEIGARVRTSEMSLSPATVQAEVVFDEGFPVDAKHHASYVFETFIPGARLLNPDFDHDYSFTCVDVNGVAAGNAFWTRAAPHSRFSIKDAARLFTE